jgi:hypothetical protein
MTGLSQVNMKIDEPRGGHPPFCLHHHDVRGQNGRHGRKHPVPDEKVTKSIYLLGRIEYPGALDQ